MARYLVTGGAGFIGSNLSRRLLADGHRVRLFDSLARGGARRNVDWLVDGPGGKRLEIIQEDVRDRAAVESAVRSVGHVFHCAGQVAVTTSVEDPRSDFDINAGGTLNVLEAARRARRPPSVLYTSTNKVYGDLGGLGIAESRWRYRLRTRPEGVDEEQPLDFHSPYGCSKGAADQYVRDYARIYGLRTTVFRMSCIYGPRQFGTEDQGWVAHFVRRAVHRQPVTLFGSGKQVRDLLYIDDLVEAFLAAATRLETGGGEVFNIGGGPANTLSLLELLELLSKIFGRPLAVDRAKPRPGDQPAYVSCIDRARERLGWAPATSVKAGLAKLVEWIEGTRE